MSQEPYIKRKPLKGQVNRQVKFINKTTELLMTAVDSRIMKSKTKQNDSSSFISNKHDGSLDSMDKMIIGVVESGIDEQQYQEENQKETKEETDLDFTQIHKQYEKLIGRDEILGEEDEEDQASESVEENSRVLIDADEDDWQMKQPTLQQKRFSLSFSPRKKDSNQIDIRRRLQKIQSKVEQMKNKKIQDISNSSIKILFGNLGNLSEIHQQKEHLLNISGGTLRKRNNEEDEQDLIDFVGQQDQQENNQNTEKKNIFADQNEGNQWEVNQMFAQNLQYQEQIQKQKDIKKDEKSANCQQILEALNLKQEYEGQSEFQQILSKRQTWIKSHKTKTASWKKRQLQYLQKMKKILKNPQYDSEDSQQ